jgi:putative ABC transport system ATP-binding protein
MDFFIPNPIRKIKERLNMNPVLSATDLAFEDMILYPPIEIEQNRTTFLSGESGCGKSTLLKLFNAVVSPSKGEVKYMGQNIETLDTVMLRRDVMLVSQTVFLFDGTIKDNFQKYYAYRQAPPPSADMMQKYLSLCCADFDLSKKCETMSGGERQRVFIAICLSFMPKVLMLDEPSSALDLATANKFFENIKAFCAANEITLIVVSHDRALAKKFADKEIYLNKKVNP